MVTDKCGKSLFPCCLLRLQQPLAFLAPRQWLNGQYHLFAIVMATMAQAALAILDLAGLPMMALEVQLIVGRAARVTQDQAAQHMMARVVPLTTARGGLCLGSRVGPPMMAPVGLHTAALAEHVMRAQAALAILDLEETADAAPAYAGKYFH